MLSGGSTPYQIYGLLKEEVTLHPQRKFFLSDERYVGAHSPLNNGHNLLPMPEELQATHQFIPVQTSLPIEEAARVYEEHLLSFDNLDLGLLGIGINDGYTVGLFLSEQLLNKIPMSAARCRDRISSMELVFPPHLFSALSVLF